MKHFVKLLMVVIISGFSINSLIAQEISTERLGRQMRSAEEMAKQQTEHMKKSLGLTEDQAAKVEAINLKYAKQREAARETVAEKREEKRTQMTEKMEAQNNELKAVLTEEQFQKLESQRAAVSKERSLSKESRKENRKENRKAKKNRKNKKSSGSATVVVE